MKLLHKFLMNRVVGACLILLSAQSTAVNLHASAVDVSYAVSGSEGDWTFDFSVTNNITAGHHIYFFGVKMSARDIVGSPSGFDPDAWASWDNTPYGGSVSDYNNNLYIRNISK